MTTQILTSQKVEVLRNAVPSHVLTSLKVEVLRSIAAPSNRPAFFDRVKMTVASAPGTGTNITLGSAVSGFRTFAAAGVPDQTLVSYVVEDGTAWEIGRGTYTAAGATLARTTVLETSAGNAVALSLSASAVVYITALAEDLLQAAPLASPVFTGTPEAPTPVANDSSLKLATTYYADRAVSNAFARTQVSDAAYTVLASDRTVAMTSLTAARTLTLPAASAYPAGATLTVVDESGACSATNTITIAAAGTDTINGAASAVLSAPYGFVALESNGSNKWTVVDQPSVGLNSTSGGPLAGFRNRIINGNFAVNQRVYVSGTAFGSGGYGHDRWRAGAGGCTYTFTAGVPDTTITITSGTLTQVIENVNIEGGTYVLSWAGTATARAYQGTAAGIYAASPLILTGVTAGTALTVEFSTGTLGKVQVELGTVVTPFERRLTVEYDLCFRYFTVTPSLPGAWGTVTTTFSVAFGFVPPMRATPSVIILNGSVNGGSAFELAVAQHVVSAVTAFYPTPTGGRIDLTTTAAAAAQRPGILELGTLGFTAEL